MSPDRKCSSVRLVKKAPEPPPETECETFLALARKHLNLPPHTSRVDTLRALTAHCHFVT